MSKDIKLPRTVYAYIAGLIDSDGCISDDGGCAAIGINNNSRPLLLHVQSLFGGSINKGNKRGLVWRCPSKKIVAFLKPLIPHLQIKRQQAYVAMALRRSVELKKSPITRARLVQKLQRLNSRHSLAPTALTIRKPRKCLHAYLAGMIDGDGWISISYPPSQPYGVRQIGVCGGSHRESKQFFRWIQVLFGGHVRIRPKSGYGKNPFLSWAAHNVRGLAPKILPYLVLKRGKVIQLLKSYKKPSPETTTLLTQYH
jgi:hypothetical protein